MSSFDGPPRDRSPDGVDPAHRRPDGTDDETVAAVGKASEALEWVARARGRLYDFHQMIGHADRQLGEAAELLEAAGHRDHARRLRNNIVGRNVIPDLWTFQIIEAFEQCYWYAARDEVRNLEAQLMDGRRHVYEAEMKARERADGPDDDI